MFWNYLKITHRNLVRHLGYTLINVFGLAIGLATVMFISLWIMDEQSYDNFHAESDRLYTLMNNSRYADGSIETYPTTPAPLSAELKAEIPEIEFAVRSTWEEEMLMTYHETSFLEKGIWADPQLFEMFTFPVLMGDKQNPLPNANSIAISTAVVEKFFPGENPLGKVVKISEKHEMIVSSVFEAIPDNSSITFDFVMPFEVHLKKNELMERWGNFSIRTFVKVYAGSSVDKVNEQMAAVVEKNCKDCIGVPILHPYSGQRLYSAFENGEVSGGRIEYVRIFMVVAIFILLIACINFMNLATARAASRSKEVGVRKVIGAQRKHLIFQFMGEALIISFIALLIALFLVELGLPSFNALTDKNTFLNFTNPVFVLSLAGIWLFTAFISGLYPAVYLSSFIPADILKGKSTSLLRGAGLKKSLVVFQFFISIFLIIGSLVIYHQTTYIREKNLGFNKYNVLTFSLRSGIMKNIEAFKAAALQYPGIKAVATSGNSPFNIVNVSTDPSWPGKPGGKEIPFKLIFCDKDFIPTLDMTVLEGRNFSANYKLDSANYIVNEAAVKVMGLEDPIGTPLDMWAGNGQIIGVVKDFHNQHFRKSIEPLVFMYMPENSWNVFVRIEDRNIESTIEHLENLYSKFDPAYPFDYTFLNEDFNQQYESEMTLNKLMVYFTIVAILISCLGLLGLATFTSQQRTKEIGIRKVLGASVNNIVVLLSKDFIKLVLLSALVALPVSWIVMHAWLENYVYRITIEPAYLILGGLVSVAIALLTVSYQSMKAALANPVDSLRNE